KIGEYYYKQKNTEEGPYYNAVVTPKAGMTGADDILTVEESYYLSFFTKENDSLDMRHIIIGCASRLGDSGLTPSRLNNVDDNKNMVHVILGNLYDQSFTFITTGSDVINDENRTVYGELQTVISIKDSASFVQNYLDDSIHIYQGFIIEASRNEGGVIEKGVTGSPRVYGTYTVEGSSYPFDFSNPDSVISITGTDENGAVDIKSYLKDSGRVTVSASVRISYDDDASIIEQFPERKTGNSTNGVTYSALSNLAYVEDNIGQSTISASAADGKSYYRDNISTVSLNYDIPALMPNELTNCGVNGLEANGEITAYGYYNVGNLPQSDMDRAASVKLTLSLYQKSTGADKSYIQVDIDEYLRGVTINGSAPLIDESGVKKVYSLTVPKGDLNSEANSFEIPTAYSVITGEEFEEQNKVYANYRVTLEAQLLDESGSSIDNTLCSDYIIYTNAKIFTEMISVG
ncbi:MAG: hypothetical protein ACI4J4_07665, partial [Ruminiclostridium sp.]